MNIAGLIYSFVLFVALTPAILFRFPSKGKKITVAAVHAIIFGIIYYFTNSFVMGLFGYKEGINWDPLGAGKAIKKAFSPAEVKKVFAPVTAPVVTPVTNAYNSVAGKVNNAFDKLNNLPKPNANSRINDAANKAVDQQVNKAAPPGTPPSTNNISKIQQIVSEAGKFIGMSGAGYTMTVAGPGHACPPGATPISDPTGRYPNQCWKKG